VGNISAPDVLPRLNQNPSWLCRIRTGLQVRNPFFAIKLFDRIGGTTHLKRELAYQTSMLIRPPWALKNMTFCSLLPLLLANRECYKIADLI
jgi:hypothetical protein